MNRDKDRTKTGVDRIVELCPRAIEVLKRQLALRERMKQAGRNRHDYLFFCANGKPFGLIRHPYDRWRWSLSMTVKGRYREPYNARHSFVSWNLMLGKNLLWVAKQHGHSVQTMLDTYGTWIDGSTQEDIEAIRQAMERRPAALLTGPTEPRLEFDPPASLPPTQRFGTGLAPEPRYECVTRGLVRRRMVEREGLEPSTPAL
jgi:integrase